MSKTGITVTLLSKSTLRVPPVSSSFLSSSQVNSSPASTQISPVSSLIISRAAKRPIISSKGTRMFFIVFSSANVFTALGVTFFPASIITFPLSASTTSETGLVPRNLSGKNLVAHPFLPLFV